jgi:hypothetical protein
LAKPTHFSNLRHVGTPVCGSQANEDDRFRPKTLKVVGARRTWVNLHYQHPSLSPRHDLDIGNQARPNRIRDYASQPLLGVSASGTPVTRLVLSSMPITRMPPAVLANATRVFNKPSGEERSRLYSRVFPSGLRRTSTRFPALHYALKPEAS